MEKQKISILIADDHSIFREGLKLILKPFNSIKITGEATNGMELVSSFKTLSPDVVLTDIKMPILDGIEATRQLYSFFPAVKIIALSIYNETHLIIEMLEAGASGFLLKDADREELVTAIETVYAHRPYFSPALTGQLTDIIINDQRLANESGQVIFSALEKQIIVMICEEKSSSQIARLLKINKRTIENYRARIMDKTGARSVAGIIAFAIQNGIDKAK